MDAITVYVNNPEQALAAGGSLWVLTWLILALPILAGVALWQHYLQEKVDAPAMLGIGSAAIWTVWTLLWMVGLVGSGALGAFTPWFAIFLFCSTMYDWGQSLFDLRPSIGDALVLSLTILASVLIIVIWFKGGWATLPPV